MTYEGYDEGLYEHITFSGYKGDVIHLWDYIKDKVNKDSDGNYSITVDGVVYKSNGVLDDGSTLETHTITLKEDGEGEFNTFTHTEESKDLTNTVNLTYSGKDKGVYYSFNITGKNGDKVYVWDYIKDKVQQDENGKYYITVNGDKYPYANVNEDLKKRFEIVNGATTKVIPFEYPKEDKE